MLVAVHSPDGSKRIDCRPNELASSFIGKIRAVFNLDYALSLEIYKQRDRTERILTNERKTLSFYNIKQGDTIYIVYKKTDDSCEDSLSSVTSSNNVLRRNSSVSSNSSQSSLLQLEDDVDTFLFKQNGYISRERDKKLCQHGTHGKCVHCIPVEPYNEAYLKEQNIKHLSFHSFLRKITDGDKGKFTLLENISCKIKPGCKEHPAWPRGICTKCQPNAITLNRQTYRHVDNVVFENTFVVERFLNYWRCTGHQRIGFLYGKYEHHKDVPLGIKAKVAAIYEPPQEGSVDYLKLLPDEKKPLVDKIASALGLVEVGWIFTDLISEDIQKGTVKHLRNISSFFLSAQECITAGYFQNEHPNPCRLASDGYFGSKYVTVCITGDMDNHVHTEGYQVSNQCMALVKDRCLVPTLDAPELGYVKESTNEQYVPDVFFKDKDSYGNEITRLARPLPIEYMLVDVPASTPVEPHFTFYANSFIKPFNVENRMVDGHVQNFSCLASYLSQFKSDQFLEAMSDFHLLIYIATMDMLPLQDALDPLLESIKTQNKESANSWAHNEQWATVEQLLEAERVVNNPGASDSPMSNDDSASLWRCRFCTYLNSNSLNDGRTCEMCSLPQ